MDIDDISLLLAKGAYPEVKERAETLANNIYRSRKEVAASVCLTEHERQAVLEAEDVLYELSMEGTTYSLGEKSNQEVPLAVQLVDEGKEAPVTKGPGGTATDITGETYPAESHYKGYAVEEYAWPATHFREEASAMQQDLIPVELRDSVAEYAHSNAGNLFGSYISEQMKQYLGGGS